MDCRSALNNLVRHSLATRIDVALELRADQLVLSIRDDGVGFDAERLFSAPAQSGLQASACGRSAKPHEDARRKIDCGKWPAWH